MSSLTEWKTLLSGAMKDSQYPSRKSPLLEQLAAKVFKMLFY